MVVGVVALVAEVKTEVTSLSGPRKEFLCCLLVA